MKTPTLLKLVEPVTEPTAEDQLRELKAKREAIYAEASRYSEKMTPTDNASARCAAIEAELSSLATRETDAAREWARGDRSSPAPGLLAEERKRLREELRITRDMAEDEAAARNTVAAASEEFARLAGGLNHEIENRVLDVISTRVENDFLAAVESWQSTVMAMAKIQAWIDILAGMRDAAVANKKPAMVSRINMLTDTIVARNDLPSDDKARHDFRMSLEKEIARLRS